MSANVFIYVYHAFCIFNCRDVGISKPLQNIYQLLIEFWSSGLVSYYNTSSGVWRAILKSSFNFLARQLSCKSLVIYLLCIIPLVVGLAVSYLPYVPVCPSLLPPLLPTIVIDLRWCRGWSCARKAWSHSLSNKLRFVTANTHWTIEHHQTNAFHVREFLLNWNK